MALFASPFDIFAIDHGHPVHDPFLHRRRRRRLLNHGTSLARHHFDPFFSFLSALDDHRMDTDDDKTRDDVERVVVFEPEVIENDLGYLLTARVPGVSAADVTVAVKPSAAGPVLSVRSTTHPHVKADVRLPGGNRFVNVADVTASCVDGVLRVAMPKVTPTSDAIVVAEPPARATVAVGDQEMEEEEEKKDEEGDDDDAHAQTIVIQVPGYSRHDITVTRKRPADELIVAGKSRRRGGGKFSRAYKLTDPDATVTATCADGLLTIRVVNPIVAPFVVPVSADKMLLAADTTKDAAAADAADAAAGENKRITTLMRHAVPGASAESFKIEVKEGKLRAHADYSVAGLGRRRFEFAVSLPSGIDRSTLNANVSDGLLTVTAATPAIPEPITVKVSGDVPAALTAAPAATAAAADDVVLVETDGGEQ